MTGSWVFSQYVVGGGFKVDWAAQAKAEFDRAMKAFQGQEKAFAAALGITVDKLRETYASVMPKLEGGNWNFSSPALAALGVPLPGCDNDRCGSMPSLDLSHQDWIHLDTSNLYWGYGFGALVHGAVDVFLGNTFLAAGIPR